MPLPKLTTGAYKVLAWAIILFGLINFFPQNPRYIATYHRLPVGPVAGFLYIGFGIFSLYSLSKQKPNGDKN
jgi:hypothetical protein